MPLDKCLNIAGISKNEIIHSRLLFLRSIYLRRELKFGRVWDESRRDENGPDGSEFVEGFGIAVLAPCSLGVLPVPTGDIVSGCVA